MVVEAVPRSLKVFDVFTFLGFHLCFLLRDLLIVLYLLFFREVGGLIDRLELDDTSEISVMLIAHLLYIEFLVLLLFSIKKNKFSINNVKISCSFYFFSIFYLKKCSKKYEITENCNRCS